MKKLIALGLLVLGLSVYAGEKEIDNRAERLSKPIMLNLFEDYGNRF